MNEPKEKVLIGYIPGLMTQSAYAEKMGISRQRVNQMVKSKEIKTVKIDGAILIDLR